MKFNRKERLALLSGRNQRLALVGAAIIFAIGATLYHWGIITRTQTRPITGTTILFIYIGALAHLWVARRRALVFFALILLALYAIADVLYYRSLKHEFWIPYIYLSMTVALTAALISQALRRRVLIGLALVGALCAAALIAPMFYLGYYFSVGPSAPDNLFLILLQTDPREALEFIETAGLTAPIVGFALLVSVFALAAFQGASRGAPIRVGVSVALIGICGATLILTRSAPRLIGAFQTYSKRYQEEIDLMERYRLERAERRKELALKSLKEEQGETYIVLIGESLNRSQMSLYGYARETSPRLERAELEVFSDAYSSGSLTIKTLPYILTEANQYNGRDPSTSPSIINIAREAGFETFWISNHTIYGDWKNLFTLIALDAETIIPINLNIGDTTMRGPNRYDEALLPALREALDHTGSKNRVIFAQMMGNHMAYSKRYPPEYAKFAGALPKKIYGSYVDRSGARRADEINTYDNATLYNDYVVNEIIELLKGTSASALIYFSDHGEELYEGTLRDPGRFDWAMTKVPLLIWLSDGYKERYPEKYRHIQANRGALFSTDLIYDTLIGLLGIKSAEYESRFDLTSSDYNLPETEAMTMEGTRRYLSAGNRDYLTRRALKRLNQDRSLKVGVADLNTIGKFKEVLHMEAESIELDIFFDRDRARFDVGSSRANLSGAELEDFLRAGGARLERLDTIWITLDRLDDPRAIARLSELEDRFGLRGKLSIIAPIDAERPGAGARENLSAPLVYSLPSKEIIDAERADEKESLDRIAHDLAAIARDRRARAINFDYDLYRFVKERLEPLLDESLVYHLNDLDLDLGAIDFFDRLDARAFRADERIATVFVSARSKFDLD